MRNIHCFSPQDCEEMEAALADAVGQQHVTFYHAGLTDATDRAARQVSFYFIKYDKDDRVIETNDAASKLFPLTCSSLSLFFKNSNTQDQKPTTSYLHRLFTSHAYIAYLHPIFRIPPIHFSRHHTTPHLGVAEIGTLEQ